MRYWICQSCKQGQVDDEKPTKCLNCGKVGGSWKSSDVKNMDSFKIYECTKCNNSVTERRPPTYRCSCGANSWRLFRG